MAWTMSRSALLARRTAWSSAFSSWGKVKRRSSRVSFVAVEVDDPGAGLLCRLDSASHFDSASVVKVTILGSLVRRAQQQHRPLTRTERALAWAMITRSDNNAASALWANLGRARLQHFLNLAG